MSNDEVNYYSASILLLDLVNSSTKRLLENINYFDTTDF